MLMATVGLGAGDMSLPTTGLGREMVSSVGRGLLGFTILCSFRSTTSEEIESCGSVPFLVKKGLIVDGGLVVKMVIADEWIVVALNNWREC